MYRGYGYESTDAHGMERTPRAGGEGLILRAGACSRNILSICAKAGTDDQLNGEGAQHIQHEPRTVRNEPLSQEPERPIRACRGRHIDRPPLGHSHGLACNRCRLGRHDESKFVLFADGSMSTQPSSVVPLAP